MKVIVLGAGVIGVSTAYYLAKSGHEVIVLEKSSASSRGCSFANGGQLSYSHIDTWSNKSALWAMAKSLIMPQQTHINIQDFSNRDFYKWLFNFIKNSATNLSLTNSEKISAISNLSKLLMHEFIESESSSMGLDRQSFTKNFSYKDNGILHFYKNKKTFDNDVARLKKLDHLNINHAILNPEECLEIEPLLRNLHNQKKLYGGIYFGDDASGDCHKFTQFLEKICREKYGVKFLFDCEIRNILTNYEKITGINTSQEVMVADKYVYCMGASGLSLLSGIGINPAIYPVKGYSLSVKCSESFKSLNIALTDSENKIFYSKLNNVIRVAGTIEMNGFNNNINPKNINFLENNFFNIFGEYLEADNALKWCGFRPFRANSVPLIGNVNQLKNLYLNSGHGSLGWTQSLASGKIIDDLITTNKTHNLDFLSAEFTNIFKGRPLN